MQRIAFSGEGLVCYGLQSYHDEMLPRGLLALVQEWRRDRRSIQNLSKIQEHVKLECDRGRCGWFVGFSLLATLTKEAPSLWWKAALWKECAWLALRGYKLDPISNVSYAELAAIEMTASLNELYDFIVNQENGYIPNLEEKRLVSDAFVTLERLSREPPLYHSLEHLQSLLLLMQPREYCPSFESVRNVFQLPSYLLYRFIVFEKIPRPDSSLRSHLAFLRIEKDVRRIYLIVTGLIHFLVNVSRRAFNPLVVAELHLYESRPNLLQALIDAYKTHSIQEKFHKYLALLQTRVDSRYLEALQITREMLEQAKKIRVSRNDDFNKRG